MAAAEPDARPADRPAPRAASPAARDASGDGWLAYEAPAKVNLYLGVHAELDWRGYHRVDSVMAAVGVADVVRVRPAAAGAGCTVRCEPSAHVPQERNTCWRAAHALARELGVAPDLEIEVEKRVPSQAGLGGASADAAAVLLALCELSGTDPADPRVARAARAVGADVPFFLTGRPSYLAGAGDVLAEGFDPLPPSPVALVRVPGRGVPTPAAYAEFDREPVPAAPLGPMLDALRAGDAAAVAVAASNNLGPVACRLHEGCAGSLQWLAARPGVLASQVSGSGSCVFALCGDDAAARAVADAARARGWWGCATRLLDHGVRRLGA